MKLLILILAIAAIIAACTPTKLAECVSLSAVVARTNYTGEYCFDRDDRRYCLRRVWER